jgi:hypothetical protein
MDKKIILKIIIYSYLILIITLIFSLGQDFFTEMLNISHSIELFKKKVIELFTLNFQLQEINLIKQEELITKIVHTNKESF